MSKLFLHAGFHKTGTTAIQQLAARNRRRLKTGGFLYPRLWPATFRPASAHHFLAHAVAGNERFVTHKQARLLISRWQRWAARSGGRVVLSSEAICRHQLGDAADPIERQRAYLERLAGLLEGFEVEPVLVVRRQDDFARSLYQEHVAAGLSDSARRTFPEFIEALGAGKIRFLERLELFRRVFGRVRVLVYEELAQGDLPRSFFEAFGVSGLEDDGSGTVRESLTVGETLVKRHLNPWLRRPMQNRALLWWLGQQRIRQAIERELGACTSLWPDGRMRQDFLARFDDENQRIAEEFLGHSGSLFPPLAGAWHDSGACSAEEQLAAVRRVVRAGRRSLQAVLGKAAVEGILRV
ncbi:hypothetical protein IC757_06675 [Wenzhouxiangella sp. AB-CW3]|uniref:hypothetical protein n=1 Tax=Wenzhouxiangella sp. AB-CW3 TaxID=2771012 RepID=UPI00168BE592|nr:hypothetical protein [Wenzhouxiangella sp. AB-CW3]QOC23804.1 hypothetical protein IC757_06675 [Wenzhouxiangella sp. AB-CW3]